MGTGAPGRLSAVPPHLTTSPLPYTQHSIGYLPLILAEEEEEEDDEAEHDVAADVAGAVAASAGAAVGEGVAVEIRSP